LIKECIALKEWEPDGVHVYYGVKVVTMRIIIGFMVSCEIDEM
jgi:hypothetical protein